ncbi:MAG: DegT/DnrJ/EryC1/StrS family aminotransferase [Candidatus Sumerlaeaceae bacterium]|nr:DegT/DnrJ/EryC1/StrS family aminotransferase [Candidatus Sumerlaeaceae bacterium]
MRVPFGDLKREYLSRRDEYDAAVRRVMESGWFVLGSEGEAFEQEFAAWVGAPYCVACNSGTDAIHLALIAGGLFEGERVVTAANTCVPTVAAIGAAHGSIGLCDVLQDCALMDPGALDEELTARPARAVVPVHLYGQAADLEGIYAVAEKHGAFVVEDAAQGHGARYDGKRIGSHGGTVAWSFYPSKNLGAFGDGGAVTTHSAELANRLRMLRNYGQEKRYYHSIPGINSRLDEVQAAILRLRLPHLKTANGRRRHIAQRYRAEIRNEAIRFIGVAARSVGCEHLFPVVCEERDRLQELLEERGVNCLIHYPVPIHLQKAYCGLGYERGTIPNAERFASTELSFPMYPELTDAEVDYVIESVNSVRL